MRLTKSTLEVKGQQPGSILAKKKFETLDEMLQAYEAMLKPLETLEERYRSYLDPIMEARQLEIYQKLIGVMQTLDQMIHKTSRTHMKQGIDTHKEIEEQMKQEDTKESGDQRDTNLSQGEQKTGKSSPKFPSITSIPKLDED